MKLNIVAQIIGGIIGVLVYYGCTGNYFIPAPDCEHGIDSPQEIAKYCANELVGSFFFVICLLTLTNKFISSA